MGWYFQDLPSCEGYLIGLACIADSARIRELDMYDRDELLLSVVQVGCECGWRSPRLHAPSETLWAPSMVFLPSSPTGERFEAEARQLWREHCEAERERQSRIPRSGALRATGAPEVKRPLVDAVLVPSVAEEAIELLGAHASELRLRRSETGDGWAGACWPEGERNAIASMGLGIGIVLAELAGVLQAKGVPCNSNPRLEIDA